ncbi:MAG TPA: FUSC family protein, partial [Myxococcota bacterium]
MRDFIARFRVVDARAVAALVPELATGVRAAVATIVPFALAAATRRPELSWMAIGGWLGTLADPGGSRSTRALVVVAFAVLGALELLASDLVADITPLAALLLALIAFTAAMLRALGASAVSLGSMLTVLAAIATARTSTDPLRDALWFLLGGGTALVLSSILWPVWTHLPVRRTVSEIARELADYSAAVARAASEPRDDVERWVRVARAHPRKVRAAIEAAREMALAIRARRTGESATGSNLRILVGSLDAQFLVLVTLASELEACAEPNEIARCKTALDVVTARYRTMASALLGPAEPQPQPSLHAAGAAVDARISAVLAQRLLDDTRDSVALACALHRASGSAVRAEIVPARAALRVDVRVVVDALSLRSPVLHHALRVTLASAIAGVLGGVISPQHAAWVTVTAIAVLQPHAGGTLLRALERVVGTVLGGFVAIAIITFVDNAAVLALIMFPLSIAAVVTRKRSYRLFVFFLTPVFVLIAMQNGGDWHTAAERALDAVVGGAAALAISFTVFPRWDQRFALPEALVAMKGAVLAYVDALASAVRSSAGERAKL